MVNTQQMLVRVIFAINTLSVHCEDIPFEGKNFYSSCDPHVNLFNNHLVNGLESTF